jgi:hypothetical protein
MHTTILRYANKYHGGGGDREREEEESKESDKIRVKAAVFVLCII